MCGARAPEKESWTGRGRIRTASPFGFDQVTLDRRPAARARGGEGRSATAHDSSMLLLSEPLSCPTALPDDDGKARRESNPRPLDYQSVTPHHRPGDPDEGRRGKRSATELRAFPSCSACFSPAPSPSARGGASGCSRPGSHHPVSVFARLRRRAMEPAGLEPATSRSQVDNPPPSARETRTRIWRGNSALPAELRPLAFVLSCYCGWRGGTLGPGTGSRVRRASGSAPAGHPSTS